jgi:hypothetical protein
MKWFGSFLLAVFSMVLGWILFTSSVEIVVVPHRFVDGVPEIIVAETLAHVLSLRIETRNEFLAKHLYLLLLLLTMIMIFLPMQITYRYCIKYLESRRHVSGGEGTPARTPGQAD